MRTANSVTSTASPTLEPRANCTERSQPPQAARLGHASPELALQMEFGFDALRDTDRVRLPRALQDRVAVLRVGAPVQGATRVCRRIPTPRVVRYLAVLGVRVRCPPAGCSGSAGSVCAAAAPAV